MLERIMLISLFLCSLAYSEISHTGLSGTNIHTVYRWQFADSAARVNQSVTAADTMKLAYQRSDSTSWILVATTGTKWKKIAYASNQNTLTNSNVSFGKINSSDSVKAVSGAFSGRITGTDIQVSDTVRGQTGYFSDIYGVTGLISPTSSDYKAGLRIAEAPNGTALIGLGATGDGSTATAHSWFITRRTSGTAYNLGLLYGGAYNFTFDTTGNFNALTINTGNGNNELYAMDQNVRSTDSINALTNKATRGHFDSLQLGSGSYLKTYVEGTFPCTLKTTYVTVQQVANAYYTKIGNVVTINFPALQGTSNSTSFKFSCKLPFEPKQTARYGTFSTYKFVSCQVSAIDNDAFVAAEASGYYDDTEFIIYRNAANWTSSGTKGFRPFTLTYIAE